MASRKSVFIGSTMMCLSIAAAGLAWGAGPSRDVAPGVVHPAATVVAVVAPDAGWQVGEASTKLFQGPAISLSKTVGTTAGVCAATSSITVPVGTAVEFCYSVQNTGSVALNYHDLVDDQLGTILDDLNLVLAPGDTAFTLVSDTPMATVTNTATWTAVTSLAGYTADDTIPYSFEDISATGTSFTLADDDTFLIPIGFTFDYFGTPYTNVEISSNGFLSVNAAGDSGCCTGDPLPDTATPNGTIAGWWEDLDPGEAGAELYYQTMGTTPNQYLLISFINVQHYPSANPVTMQYKLFENGSIEVHYQDAPSDGGTHSAGIENQDGSAGVQYFLGTAALATPLAVRYSLVPVQSASDTASATVTVQAPNIDVSPLTLASTQMPNTTAQQTLTIANTGSQALNWNIVEEPIAEAPDMLSGGTPALAGESIGPSDFKPGQSWGTPAVLSDWRAPEALLYDNGPLVTHPAGGAGGADASALQSAILLDTYGFGYQLTAGNRLADDFVVTGGGWFIETITFFGYQTGSSTTSTFTSMNLQIWDGPPDNPASMIVFGDTTTNRLTGSVWSNIYRVLDTSLSASDRPIMANTVAVNTFLPAGTYWADWQADATLASGPWAPPISILGQTDTGNAMQWTGAWAAALDTGSGTQQGFPFIIDGTSDCSNPVDVPWLSFTPISGTTANGSSTPVAVTFDSTGLTLGNYDARLCVFSDDPDIGPGNGTGLVVVPASLIVSQTAPSISVSKTVGTAAGVCATSSNITVPQGSTVYYCYTVTNTGDTAFALHDLEDDQLGTIFSGLSYALAPGASIDTVTAGLSVSAVINVPTTNVGTWTAYNAAAGGVQGQATATVNVTAAEAIPTLDGLGLLILVLLLAGTGVLALRRLS